MSMGVVADDNIYDINFELDASYDDLNMEWGRKTLCLMRRQKTMNCGIESTKCFADAELTSAVAVKEIIKVVKNCKNVSNPITWPPIDIIGEENVIEVPKEPQVAEKIEVRT